MQIKQNKPKHYGLCKEKHGQETHRIYCLLFSSVVEAILEDCPNLSFQLKRDVEKGDKFWIGYPERNQDVRDLKLMTSEETKGS